MVGVEILKVKGGDPFWAESLTKLKFFELTQYKRLIYFDVDGLVLKNMNHLFALPSAPVAMPRAHWLPQPYMSDQLAVIEPSARALDDVLHQAATFGETLCSAACFALTALPHGALFGHQHWVLCVVQVHKHHPDL